MSFNYSSYRTHSAPNSDGEYSPPGRSPVRGSDTFYHVTDARNAPAIHHSGGLMPRGRQPQGREYGLDAQRGDQRDRVEDHVGRHVENYRRASELPEQWRESVLSSGRNEARTALQYGSNSQSTYMTRSGENVSDYMTNPSYMEHGASVYRGQFNTQRSGFVPDDQGHSGDYRSFGLHVPSHELDRAQLSGQEVREHVSNDYGNMHSLPWQQYPY